MDSPSDQGSQTKKARKDDKQQRKRQPPKFDEGSVIFSLYAVVTAHCGYGGIYLRPIPQCRSLLATGNSNGIQDWPGTRKVFL
jgi:hypothetical protein